MLKLRPDVGRVLARAAPFRVEACAVNPRDLERAARQGSRPSINQGRLDGHRSAEPTSGDTTLYRPAHLIP